MKFRKSIFTEMMIGFVTFFVLFLATLIGCLFLAVSDMSNGDIENLTPYHHIDSYGRLTNIENITGFGGWIEELDSEYNVIEIYGTKKNTNMKYTQNEIYSLLSPDGDNDFIGFMFKPENNEHYFLILYQRELFLIQTTLVADTDKTSAAYHRTYYFIILFFILIILEMIGISVYLRKKIKKPLQQLNDGMERIKSGESNVILDIKTEAEFEQIVDAFNTMTENLEREKEEKRKLLENKNRLLLELSHDLRTPIATIKSCANALEEGLVPTEKIQSYYHTIDLKADRVQLLSEQMFFMLKADSSKERLEPEETDVCEFLRKLCAGYYDEIEDAGFLFEINIPETPIVTAIDRRLFARVIGNLLSNAIKYNRTGSVIEIGCTLKQEHSKQEHVMIYVSDDGEKIDKKLSEQMFTAFVRGDKTRSSSGGTGLGLSICKIIAEKHGGTLCYKWENGRNRFELKLRSFARNS